MSIPRDFTIWFDHFSNIYIIIRFTIINIITHQIDNFMYLMEILYCRKNSMTSLKINQNLSKNNAGKHNPLLRATPAQCGRQKKTLQVSLYRFVANISATD